MTRDRALPGDDIVALISLVMTGVALLSLGSFPTRALEFQVLDTPLSIVFSARWLVALCLILLTSAGMDTLVRNISGREQLDLRFSLSFWVLPSLVTLAAVSSLPRQFENTAGWAGTLLSLSALLAMVVVAECGTVDLDQPHYRLARLGLNIATYGAAMALYTSIYGLQERSLISSTAIILITFPLAIELLRRTEEQLASDWMYAGIIALVVGQVSWPLNAMGLRALHGGALLMLLFYTLTGITQQHLADRLEPRVVLEFVGLAAILAGLVGFSAWRSAEAGQAGQWPAPDSEYPGQFDPNQPVLRPGEGSEVQPALPEDLDWPAPPLESMPDSAEGAPLPGPLVDPGALPAEGLLENRGDDGLGAEGAFGPGGAPAGASPVPARPADRLDKP